MRWVGRPYLARSDAIPLDPIELPLAEHTYETHRLKGVFGALRDASPDYWGRRVITKHAGLTQLGEIDFLLHSPDDRAGALSSGRAATPPAPVRTYNRTVDLYAVARGTGVSERDWASIARAFAYDGLRLEIR